MHPQHPSTSVPSVPLAGSSPPMPPGQWSVLGAFAFVALVVGAAMGSAVAVQMLYDVWRDGLDPIHAHGFPMPTDPTFLMSVQLGGQLLQLVLIWWLVGRWHADRSAALGLAPPNLTLGGWVGAVVLLFTVKIAATLVASGLTPTDIRKEVGPFIELVRTPQTWLLFLAAVVLAGLTEELLFRGVLSRTLEATRLGFWGGAAIASTTFALLHMQYGIGGQFVIFAVGMALAWIRASSGSLWPAVVCHSLNNAVALLAMLAIR